MALAGQALTVADAIGQRLTVGVGLSHEPMMAQPGNGFDRPIRHLREYLSILMPLLRRGRSEFQWRTAELRRQALSKDRNMTCQYWLRR